MTTKRLILLAAIALAIAAVARKCKAQGSAEWQGLTESKVRAKLDAKLPGRIPDDKRAAISDKIVSTMRDRGVITDDENDVIGAEEFSQN